MVGVTGWIVVFRGAVGDGRVIVVLVGVVLVDVALAIWDDETWVADSVAAPGRFI